MNIAIPTEINPIGAATADAAPRRRTFKLRREMQCGANPTLTLSETGTARSPEPLPRSLIEQRTSITSLPIGMTPKPTDHAPTGLGSRFNANYAASKKTIELYVNDIKNIHRYHIRGILFTARMDMEALRRNNGRKVSPFATMKQIQIKQIDARDHRLDIESRLVYGEDSQKSTLKLCTTRVAPNEKPTKVPTYKAYRTLRANTLGNNENQTLYIPHPRELMGQNTADDGPACSSGNSPFILDERMVKESALYYGQYISDLFANLGTTDQEIRDYLIGDLGHITDNDINACRTRRDALPEKLGPIPTDLSSRPAPIITVEQFLLTAPICQAFKDTTSISIWYIVGMTHSLNGEGVKQKIERPETPINYNFNGLDAKLQPHRVQHEQLIGIGSYGQPFCPECFRYHCQLYRQSGFRHPEPLVQSVNSETDNSCPSLPQALKVVDSLGVMTKECSKSCFLRTGEGPRYQSSPWSQAEYELLRSSATALGDSPRCSCLIGLIIKKPCWDIHNQLGGMNLLRATPIRPPHSDEAVKKVGTKRGRKPNQTARWLHGYPASCDRAFLHHTRPEVNFCGHAGICKPGCACVDNHVNCEKFCTCPLDCPRRWKGCDCKKKAKTCAAMTCDCFKANRECDPELCLPCGASEVLLETNRYNFELQESCCQNIGIQRGVPKRTLLGISAVAGMGLYIGEDVRRGDYLGEYTGELIEEKEAAHRHCKTYLFQLNRDQTLDAVRAGNKFRFINHSSDKPNVKPKVVMADCAHRIGMYATKKILSGEELFFDYGYQPGPIQGAERETQASGDTTEEEMPMRRGRKAKKTTKVS